MDNADKLYLLALAYTATTEKGLDQSAFLQKLEENQSAFSALQKKKRPPKVRVPKRSSYGI